MADQTGTGGETATFILLSYARPQNMQLIINAIRQARCCGRIILSNNHPDVNIYDYIDTDSDRLEVIQQKRRFGAVKRFTIARECEADFFFCIDDDLFLTPEQIDRLFDELIKDRSRPHGVWGLEIVFENELLVVKGSIHHQTREVAILNQAYAFTRDHLRRFFELVEDIRVAEPDDLGPFDDIVLSFSGTRPPKCHDLGPLELCKTWDQEGVALWKDENFVEPRMKLYARLLHGSAWSAETLRGS